MGRIAHIQLTCPSCEKITDAYIEESDAASADVRCQHCKTTFEFGPGTLYRPIRYVTSVPPGVGVSRAQAPD